VQVGHDSRVSSDVIETNLTENGMHALAERSQTLHWDDIVALGSTGGEGQDNIKLQWHDTT
jgi:hypothetical protein